MKISWLVRPEAEADLRNGYQWYEKQKPGLGEDFLACIEAALFAIQDNPYSYPEVHREVRRALVHRFPYAVFYLPCAESIVVLAVFDCRRDPETWRGRMSGKVDK